MINLNNEELDFDIIEDSEISKTLKVSGKIDTLKSIDFEKKVKDLISNIKDKFRHLKLDFCDLEYLCSSGLRVILWAKKQMEKVNKDSSIIIINPQDGVLEILDTTGFSDEVVEIEYTQHGENNDIS